MDDDEFREEFGGVLTDLGPGEQILGSLPYLEAAIEGEVSDGHWVTPLFPRWD